MKKFFMAFVFAAKGLLYALSSQLNLKIHLLAVVVVCIAAIYFHISAFEWAVLLLCFALVIGLELMNTALELLCDALHPEKNEHIGKAKDVAAGAVLVSAFISILVALIVFGNRVLSLFF